MSAQPLIRPASLDETSADAPVLHLLPLWPGDRTLIQVTGELDLATAHCLPDFIRGLAPADCLRVHVDLSGVAFLDAVGLDALTRADQAVRRRAGRMTVGGLGPLARRLVDITALPVTVEDCPVTPEARCAG